MSQNGDTEKKSYLLETYLIAGFGLSIMATSADDVRALNRPEQWASFFYNEYGSSLEDRELTSALVLMRDLNLLAMDEDPFAGTYVSVQKTAFTAQLKNLAHDLSDSPIAIALRAGRLWVEEVFEKEKFWEQLSASLADQTGDEAESAPVEREIPASDRTVTLLHNSPERVEIERELDRVAEALRTSNEIADQLGDDRERITAEFNSIKVGIASEKVRLGYIRDFVLKALRELSSKLRDKAVEVGVDKLMILFEKLLDHFL